MKRTDFHYSLPPQLIAQAPLAQRSASRLLVLNPQPPKRIEHQSFSDLPQRLQPEDLLVFNNTRVIPARLWGQKETGGKIEILVERMTSATTLVAQVRSSKSPRPGTRLLLAERPDAPAGAYAMTVTGRDGAMFELASESGIPITEILNTIGHMPLPPYIEREDDAADRERYQTVYASADGAVAAPTAGLHFTPELLAQIDGMGVQRVEVTLHVGAGTFAPVREDDILQHQMHREWMQVDAQVCAAVQAARQRGGRVVAVGTTAVRALESASQVNGQIAPFAGDTDIFIYPGYRFHSVDAMITNFHLPESTLMMLVSAFAGRETILEAYAEAVDQAYRFFSYGDAMLIESRIDND